MRFAPFAFEGSVSSVASLTYITNVTNTNDAAGYTFTGISINNAGLVAVAIQAEGTNNTTITGVTINGNPANIAVQAVGSVANSYVTSAIAYLRVTTTTVSVNINFTAGRGRCFIGVWRIDNNNSDTPISTNSANASSGTGLSINLTGTTLTNVGIVGQTNGTQNTTVSYTNATVRYNVAPENLTQASGADFSTTTPGTRTITTSFTSSTQPICLVGAVWN
jgi:hypothetical protein